MGGAIQKLACTPFVIESTLYWANIWREISPCFFATPFTKRLLSSAR